MDPHVKSKEIPEKNEEPVKVVVRKAFDNMVLESSKKSTCTKIVLDMTMKTLKSPQLPCQLLLQTHAKFQNEYLCHNTSNCLKCLMLMYINPHTIYNF